MSIAQQNEAALLRHQMESCRAAADILISAARNERDKEKARADTAEANFLRCIYFAALGWALLSALCIVGALHYGIYHSSRGTQGASVEAPAAPLFPGVAR